MRLNAGDMWTRITIEQATTTRNAVGESTLSWTTFATVWASVESLSARETERFAETLGFMTHKIRIRYLNGLTSAMRIVYRNRVLEIGQITEQDRLWHQEIICTEKRDASFVPTVPSAPIITLASVGINQVVWTTPSDGGASLMAYKLYRNGIQVEPAESGLGWLTQALESYDVGSVMRVSAVNAVGEGPLSDPVTVS